MTCIVGIETETCVYVAGDLQGSSENMRADYYQSKVFSIGGVVIGYTTSYRFGQILEVHLSRPTAPPTSPEEVYRWLIKSLIPDIRGVLLEAKEDCGQALLAVHNQLYRLESNFAVLRSTNGYDAVGCGEQYALGSLHTQISSGPLEAPQVILEKALAAAHHLSPGVGKSHTILCT